MHLLFRLDCKLPRLISLIHTTLTCSKSSSAREARSCVFSRSIVKTPFLVSRISDKVLQFLPRGFKLCDGIFQLCIKRFLTVVKSLECEV